MRINENISLKYIYIVFFSELISYINIYNIIINLERKLVQIDETYFISTFFVLFFKLIFI
jgi:hypothetical protein